MVPMIGMTGLEHATRSSRHVNVSSHRFSWITAGSTDWNKIDVVHPSVALRASGSAPTLLEACYQCQPLQWFTKLEEIGLHTATYGFLDFDLDVLGTG